MGWWYGHLSPRRTASSWHLGMAVISPMDRKLQRPSVLAPLQQEWWLDSLAFPYLYTSELQHLCFSLWVLLSLHTLRTWEIHYFLIHIPEQEVSYSGPADVNASGLFFFPLKLGLCISPQPPDEWDHLRQGMGVRSVSS